MAEDGARDDGEDGRGRAIPRLAGLVLPPALALGGIVAVTALEIGYPGNVGVGVVLFGLLWFWFRALGRLVF